MDFVSFYSIRLNTGQIKVTIKPKVTKTIVIKLKLDKLSFSRLGFSINVGLYEH